jgi:hypothetical protein
MSKGHVHLQETLCDDVLALMLAHPNVRAARVSTEKPDVYPDCEAVGVEVFGLKEASMSLENNATTRSPRESAPAQFDEQATAARRKAAYEINKLSKRLHRQVGAAIIDFNMIEEGDKVMVCLSGGKDSYAMLDILLSLRERSPVKFDMSRSTSTRSSPAFPSTCCPTTCARAACRSTSRSRTPTPSSRSTSSPARRCARCARACAAASCTAWPASSAARRSRWATTATTSS